MTDDQSRNYDWTEYDGKSLFERFPDWIEGYELLQGSRAPEELLRALAEARSQRPRPPRPRVFVSHRQPDVGLAKQIAHAACMQSFDYWLDVFDPNLDAAMNAPSPIRSLAIAIAIEIGLLNSTHVIAVMTKDTPGSQWVPYEYGRVKEPTPVTLQAASWIASTFPHTKFPEYLLLGPVLTTSQDLDAWLASERTRYAAPSQQCSWKGVTPPSL